MNPYTSKFLEGLWEGGADFALAEKRLKKECRSMKAPEAGVIGRDLLLRKRALYNKTFNLAAFLASDSLAGNDGFMDFADCVAILPEDRYEAILNNPDVLVDEPVSAEFFEGYLVRQVCDVFDKSLFGKADGEQFLDYLVFGEEDGIDWDEMAGWTEEFAKENLPKLYAEFGDLLKPRSSKPSSDRAGDSVELKDLISDLDG